MENYESLTNGTWYVNINYNENREISYERE